MNKLRNMLVMAGCVAALGLSNLNVQAQGQGNFDPAQFRQRRMDRIREQMDVKDDAEWKAIESAITKVMDAQQEVMSGRFGGFGRGGRGGGGNTNNATGDQGGQNGRRRGGG